MINYIKKHIFVKIAALFFVASFCIVFSSYYISIYWVNFEKDDILDAHEAYFQYRLVESWGPSLDTLLIERELDNLHLKAMIFYMDEDIVCENDSLLVWSNLDPVLSSCDYYSYLNSDEMGEKYDIDYAQWVSFGEIRLENKLQQTTYVESPPYKYFLIADHVSPSDFTTLFPSLLLVLLLMGLMFLVVRRFLFPLNLIEKRIKSLEKGDLDSVIPIIGHDELSVLAQNFNSLTADIKKLLKQKERLLSDVSHELRTPLAKIKLAIEMLPEHSKKESINKQIKNLDSMITNILLSDKMASAYSNLKLEQIHIGDLINKALELTSIKGVELSLDKSIMLKVDVVKASIAIKNLIENAYKYSPEGALIRVSSSQTKQETAIEVFDLGPGIPNNQLTAITKAFVRIPGSKKTGFGLGLSICHKVMAAHGGHLSIKNIKSGGACFSLIFHNEK